MSKLAASVRARLLNVAKAQGALTPSLMLTLQDERLDPEPPVTPSLPKKNELDAEALATVVARLRLVLEPALKRAAA